VIKRAQKMVDGHDVELWQHACKVRTRIQVAKSGTRTTTGLVIQWFGPYHYWIACETHAPLFWESEPPARFAHTPLPNSSSAILSPIVCVIFNSVSDLQVPCT
jgi:hypothetical protein